MQFYVTLKSINRHSVKAIKGYIALVILNEKNPLSKYKNIF